MVQTGEASYGITNAIWTYALPQAARDGNDYDDDDGGGVDIK